MPEKTDSVFSVVESESLSDEEIVSEEDEVEEENVIAEIVAKIEKIQTATEDVAVEEVAKSANPFDLKPVSDEAAKPVEAVQDIVSPEVKAVAVEQPVASDVATGNSSVVTSWQPPAPQAKKKGALRKGLFRK